MIRNTRLTQAEIIYLNTARDSEKDLGLKIREVQSLELHQYKSAMVLSTILIKNKVFLHYKMVFDEILNHNVYLFVLTLT